MADPWEQIESEDPPLPWLVATLREIAREWAADRNKIWAGALTPNQHVCWIAADLIEASAKLRKAA